MDRPGSPSPDFFSPDYAAARSRFRATATNAGARLESLDIAALVGTSCDEAGALFAQKKQTVQRALGTKVSLRLGKRNQGALTIYFYSDEELEGVLDRLGVAEKRRDESQSAGRVQILIGMPAAKQIEGVRSVGTKPIVRRMPVSGPSLISNTRSTRFCGNWMIFGSTVAAKRPLRW